MIRYRRPNRVLAQLALAIAATACGEPTAVSSLLSATYVLQSSNGVALPTVVTQGGGQTYVLIADTLRFQPDGQVRRRWVIHWTSTSPTPLDTVYSQQSTLPYEISGHSLLMGFRMSCGPNANCVGSERGSIDSETATVVSRIFWSGEPVFVFRRL